MIKGIDAQIMTNRAAEYSKDVSQMLRRDELANEFANRLNQHEAAHEMRSVTQVEELRYKHINDDGGGRHQQEEAAAHSGETKPKKKKGQDVELPYVGTGEPHLLDIEV